jgi:hypothetical protein
MTEEIVKEYDEDKDKEEKEDKEKASGFEASLNDLTETIKGFDSDLRNEIKNIGSTVAGIDSRLKALEEPTDLPLKPKVQAEDDIGAKTKVPDTYQSNSQQAGIKEADPENNTESDKNGLAMQEKSQLLTKSEQVFTTETPRPNAALETVEKSSEIGLSEVLKAARETGFDELGRVGKRILKGDFGGPNEGEIARW